jgi:hypothetical protein
MTPSPYETRHRKREHGDDLEEEDAGEDGVEASGGGEGVQRIIFNKKIFCEKFRIK